MPKKVKKKISNDSIFAEIINQLKKTADSIENSLKAIINSKSTLTLDGLKQFLEKIHAELCVLEKDTNKILTQNIKIAEDTANPITDDAEVITAFQQNYTHFLKICLALMQKFNAEELVFYEFLFKMANFAKDRCSNLTDSIIEQYEACQVSLWKQNVNEYMSKIDKATNDDSAQKNIEALSLLLKKILRNCLDPHQKILRIYNILLLPMIKHFPEKASFNLPNFEEKQILLQTLFQHATMKNLPLPMTSPSRVLSFSALALEITHYVLHNSSLLQNKTPDQEKMLFLLFDVLIKIISYLRKCAKPKSNANMTETTKRYDQLLITEENLLDRISYYTKDQSFILNVPEHEKTHITNQVRSHFGYFHLFNQNFSDVLKKYPLDLLKTVQLSFPLNLKTQIEIKKNQGMAHKKKCREEIEKFIFNFIITMIADYPDQNDPFIQKIKNNLQGQQELNISELELSSSIILEDLIMEEVEKTPATIAFIKSIDFMININTLCTDIIKLLRTCSNPSEKAQELQNILAKLFEKFLTAKEEKFNFAATFFKEKIGVTLEKFIILTRDYLEAYCLYLNLELKDKGKAAIPKDSLNFLIKTAQNMLLLKNYSNLSAKIITFWNQEMADKIASYFLADKVINNVLNLYLEHPFYGLLSLAKTFENSAKSSIENKGPPCPFFLLKAFEEKISGVYNQFFLLKDLIKLVESEKQLALEKKIVHITYRLLIAAVVNNILFLEKSENSTQEQNFQVKQWAKFYMRQTRYHLEAYLHFFTQKDIENFNQIINQYSFFKDQVCPLFFEKKSPLLEMQRLILGGNFKEGLANSTLLLKNLSSFLPAEQAALLLFHAICLFKQISTVKIPSISTFSECATLFKDALLLYNQLKNENIKQTQMWQLIEFANIFLESFLNEVSLISNLEQKTGCLQQIAEILASMYIFQAKIETLLPKEDRDEFHKKIEEWQAIHTEQLKKLAVEKIEKEDQTQQAEEYSNKLIRADELWKKQIAEASERLSKSQQTEAKKSAGSSNKPNNNPNQTSELPISRKTLTLEQAFDQELLACYELRNNKQYRQAIDAITKKNKNPDFSEQKFDPEHPNSSKIRHAYFIQIKASLYIFFIHYTAQKLDYAVDFEKVLDGIYESMEHFNNLYQEFLGILIAPLNDKEAITLAEKIKSSFKLDRKLLLVFMQDIYKFVNDYQEECDFRLKVLADEREQKIYKLGYINLLQKGAPIEKLSYTDIFSEGLKYWKSNPRYKNQEEIKNLPQVKEIIDLRNKQKNLITYLNKAEDVINFLQLESVIPPTLNNKNDFPPLSYSKKVPDISANKKQDTPVDPNNTTNSQVKSNLKFQM